MHVFPGHSCSLSIHRTSGVRQRYCYSAAEVLRRLGMRQTVRLGELATPLLTSLPCKHFTPGTRHFSCLWRAAQKGDVPAGPATFLLVLYGFDGVETCLAGVMCGFWGWKNGPSLLENSWMEVWDGMVYLQGGNLPFCVFSSFVASCLIHSRCLSSHTFAPRSYHYTFTRV